MNYITGTTRGLGKALLQYYSTWHPQTPYQGLNRPIHFLQKLDSYVKTDFDTYIINAHHEWSQVELLYKLFEMNRQRVCEIIVIGSVSADGDRKEINKYAIQKKALDAACTQLQLVDSHCRVTQIKLGRMDTDLVAHIKAPKMDVKEVARSIDRVLSINSKSHYVKSVTIDIKE